MMSENSLSGIVTLKVDFDAFGIVLLEILSGQEVVKMQKNPGTST